MFFKSGSSQGGRDKNLNVTNSLLFFAGVEMLFSYIYAVWLPPAFFLKPGSGPNAMPTYIRRREEATCGGTQLQSQCMGIRVGQSRNSMPSSATQ